MVARVDNGRNSWLVDANFGSTAAPDISPAISLFTFFGIRLVKIDSEKFSLQECLLTSSTLLVRTIYPCFSCPFFGWCSVFLITVRAWQSGHSNSTEKQVKTSKRHGVYLTPRQQTQNLQLKAHLAKVRHWSIPSFPSPSKPGIQVRPLL